jgi:hypothetical protein
MAALKAYYLVALKALNLALHWVVLKDLNLVAWMAARKVLHSAENLALNLALHWVVLKALNLVAWMAAPKGLKRVVNLATKMVEHWAKNLVDWMGHSLENSMDHYLADEMAALTAYPSVTKFLELGGPQPSASKMHLILIMKDS